MCFLYFHFGGVWSPEEPLPPQPCTQMTGVFDCEKPPTPSTTQEGLGMHHHFCMYSTHLFQLWSQKLAPLRHTGCISKILWRFSLHRYLSLQVNILSDYSAISHQATRTVVCFFGGFVMKYLKLCDRDVFWLVSGNVCVRGMAILASWVL